MVVLPRKHKHKADLSEEKFRFTWYGNTEEDTCWNKDENGNSITRPENSMARLVTRMNQTEHKLSVLIRK